MPRKIDTSDNRIIFTVEPDAAVREVLSRLGDPDALVVTDTNVEAACRHLFPALVSCPTVVLEAGEQHKNILSLQRIWQAMMDARLLRSDVEINLGGGVVTDCGGFAAATYMRGIRYINIPTTLLADVDAASGGKTAIDFGGVKNIVGAFHAPEATIVAPQPLRTLDRREMLSGYGEMLKHALLDSEKHLLHLLSIDLFALSDSELIALIKRSAEVKRRITQIDPKEQGIRRSLNAGHTVGHALEALMISKESEISHGHAVALGLLAELGQSRNFPEKIFNRLKSHILALYPPVALTSADLPMLGKLMASDKKNRRKDADHISYISFDAPGKADIYAEASAEALSVSLLDALRD